MQRFQACLRALSCIGVVAVAAVARADAAAEPNETAVIAALSGREWSPNTPTMTALGPGAANVLMRLADESTPHDTWIRVRALLALRAFPTPAVEQYLLSYVRVDHPAPFLRAALDSLSNAFGESDPHAVIDAAEPLLHHPDESVQRAARAARSHARVRGAIAHGRSQSVR